MDSDKPEYAQACAVLYDAPAALDTARIESALRTAGARECAVTFAGQSHAAGHPVIHGQAALDGHTVQLISVAAPAADDATQMALRQALLTDEERQRLLGHHAYIHCVYQSGSDRPLDQLRALYRVAGALVACTRGSGGPAALGLVDVPALQAFAADTLLEMVRWLDADPPPIGLWVRLAGVSGRRGDTWLLTRGLAHFACPELALRGRDATDAENAEALLMSIALWMIQGAAAVKAGDKLEMLTEGSTSQEGGISRWQCRVPDRELGWLAGPFGTLVLAPAG